MIPKTICAILAIYKSKQKRWRYPRIILGSIGLIAAMFLLFVGYLQGHGNFHEVVKNELYRSAQPSPDLIIQAHQQHGIKTIINLRGISYTPWYKAEIETAKQLDITHIDYDMHARKFLPKSEVLKIIHMLKTAEKPILIHCKSGADRAGLVSALYVGGIAGGTEAEAESQLSIRYGHFSLPFIGEYNMDRILHMMKPDFGFSDPQS